MYNFQNNVFYSLPATSSTSKAFYSRSVFLGVRLLASSVKVFGSDTAITHILRG